MKKIKSVIIAMSLMIAMIGVASATGIDNITIGGDTQGQNGQTKSVTVDVIGMSEVGALQLDVMYSSAVITVNTVTFGPAAGAGLTASNIDNPSGKVTLGVISATGISGSGTLATISFTVAGNAPDTTAITIIKKSLKDFNVLPVTTEPTIAGRTFTVIGAPPSTGIDNITISGDTQGQNGQSKSVNVDVTGMAGVGALQLDVMYNPAVISVNTVTFGPAAGAGLTASNIDNPSGKVTLGVISATGISGSGTLATISFTVAGNAPDATSITIIKTNLKDFNVLPVTKEPTISGGIFTVIGGTSPSCTITAPIDITTVATGTLTTVSLGSAITSNCGTNTVVNDAPAGGFPVGTTTVTWSVTGTSATDTQLVTITPQPVQLSIVAPADIIETSTGTLTQIANLGTPTVTGGTPPYNTVNDAPAAGFPVGVTTVTWMVTDSNQGTASDTQLVTINDTGPIPPIPELSPMILTTAGMIGLLFLVVRNRR